MKKLNLDLKYFAISESIKEALSNGKPVVALESTVITHGLPKPDNFQLASDMELEIRKQGVFPATIAVLNGVIRIGLSEEELSSLANEVDVHKISIRDFSPAVVKQWSGGTTVAGTIFIANQIGIRVMATGGIGGIHRQPPYDISTDLPQLAKTPMIVVCSGAKAILDLPATVEYLETAAIPVLGYRTAEFPAFYSKDSGLVLSVSVDSPSDIVSVARRHWGMGLESAILVVQPPPESDILSYTVVQRAIEDALLEAEDDKIRGQAVTPYLLNRVSELTGGASLKTNLALLRNNARLAAQISKELITSS